MENATPLVPVTQPNPLDNLNSKKFIFAVLVVIMGFILVLLRIVPATSFFSFATYIGGIYVIGNVAATVANNFINP